ncbi:MAG: stage II sporulation protein R [Tyzzerella sp.]|nr:stage II sporulation protein R [Tyzzerella sp.]
MKKQRKFIICILVGVALSALTTGFIVRAKEIRVQERMAEEVFRFHVLANSDSEADQALKMQVKEAVLALMKEELPESGSVEETKEWAETNLDAIEKTALQVIESEGYDYNVTAKVTICYFPEKTYGDITFPSGEYEALRIEIGKAQGQNWWCVLYPNLCFIDAVHAVVPEEGKEELKEVLDEDAYEMVTTKTRFRIKWFFF